MATIGERLMSGVAEAQKAETDGGAKVTKYEASGIVSSLLRQGAAPDDIKKALSSSTLPGDVKTALSDMLEQADRAHTYGAKFSGAAPVKFSLAKQGAPQKVGDFVRPEALAQEIPSRVATALENLKAGGNATRALAPLLDADGAGWQVRPPGSPAWGSGSGTDLGQVLKALNVPDDQAALILSLVKQQRVAATMEKAMGHAPAMPPTAKDLKDYGAALAKQSPKPTAKQCGEAFSAYASAFHQHTGNRDVNYADPATADLALPPSRPYSNEVRTLNDCEGFALVAKEFFAGAGFNCQFVEVDSKTDGDAGHTMLWATRGNDGILASNDKTYPGTAGQRDKLVQDGLSQTVGDLGTNHKKPSFQTKLH